MKTQLTSYDIASLVLYMNTEMKEKCVVLAELDSLTGDGDMGITITLCFRAMTRALKYTDGMTISEMFDFFSEEVGENAPSTFGTLVAAMLNGMAEALVETVAIGAAEYAISLCAASESVMKRGGAKLGEKTLLDALIPAAQAAELAVKEGKSLGECAAEAAAEAFAGAERTIEMKAVTGRAGYMGQRTVGYKDPGAEAIAMMLAVVEQFVNV